MGKIEINTENVVIGSRTLIEYKFQVLNFLNLIYSDGVEKLKGLPRREYEYVNSDFHNRLRPWFNNLTFEIQRVRDGINDKTKWGDYLSLIEHLEAEIFKGKSKAAEAAWMELFEFLTESLELKKEIEFIVVLP